MIRVAILYPRRDDSWFDWDYFIQKHIPLVNGLLQPLGLVRGEADEGLGTAVPGQPSPFLAIGYLYFQTLEDLQNALGQHSPRIMADMPHYTNIEPQIQISRILDVA